MKNPAPKSNAQQDRVVISPPRREWNLNELLSTVTSSNKHQEADWGDRIGDEFW